MKPFCFADGEIIESKNATIHPMDLGLIRGYGIFDFFRSVNYKPLFLDHYLDRFITSAEKTYLPLAYNREELKQIIKELTDKNDMEQGGFRMVLSGGLSDNHFSPAKGKLFIFPETLLFPSEEKYSNGIKLLSLDYVRPIADIKTTNYALSVWDSIRWKKEGAEDALYHRDGFVSESSRSNFFIVKEGKVITPNKDILLGITRKHILQLTEKVDIRPVTLSEVFEAEEAFISSTTKILLPVTQIDEHKIGNGKPGPISLDLLEKFKLLEKENSY
ncbi:aminotransferase class IV [Algoriphagus sp. SE2]|uniref:aminotransferase class IV n=1 Tax=Algoriphagus sp. SE2 TaxID=3141536 RepID=UPI0031CD5EA1